MRMGGNLLEKAYTVKEVDELRQACWLRWHFGTTNLSGRSNASFGRSYGFGEETKGVDEFVRTYMTAGLTAEDIYKADRQSVTQ